MSNYAFGDSQRAAKRLKFLADVFAPLSQPFVAEAVDTPPDLVIDLGCGPGHTTRMLAAVAGARQTLGLEYSPEFVQIAREQNGGESIEFAQCDITQTPFAEPPADMMYARYVLTHLREPLQLVERWAEQIKPGGLLLLEEIEWIHCGHGAFDRYLEIVAAMLAAQGNELYLGPDLAAAATDSETYEVKTSRVGEIAVSTQQATTLFCPNIADWKMRPFIAENYDSAEIAQLENELAALRQGGDDVKHVWGLRQLALKKIA